MKAKIVTLSETGSDSTQIRSYIVNAYNTWDIRPEYLLIVGTKYQVPFPHYYHSFNLISFSDNYYANMTGDFHNELYHGRLWVSDTAQLRTVIAKILGYEKIPYTTDPLWFRKGATIVNEYEPGQPPSDSLYWADARFAIQHMANAGYVHIDSFSYSLGHDSADVINAINDGRTYILYRGLAGGDWTWPFAGIHAAQMTNGFKMPVVLSVTCATIEGIGHDWLVAGTANQPRGVVGFYGTTTSLFAAAEMRSALCLGTTASLFGNATGNLGKAAEAGRLEYYSQFQDLIEYHSWILLGDPEMQMWTDTPKDFTVGHNMYFTTGICTTTVIVEHGAAPVESALVCVAAKFDSTFYHYGYTSNSGNVQFVDTLHIPGDSVYITVTGHNYRPFHNVRPVLYANGPYVRLYSFDLLDSIIGNNDNIANPGEDIEIPFVLRNWGNDTAYDVSSMIEKLTQDTNFVLYDTFKTIGNVAPYTNVNIGPDGYNVFIDSSCPDLHEIDLCLQITDTNNNTWVSEFSFTVHAPTISVSNYYFNGHVKYTPPGAGNQLTVELFNSGSCTAENVTGKISCGDTLFTVTDSFANFGDILSDSLGSNEANPFGISTSGNAPPCYPVELELVITTGVIIDTFHFTVYIGQKDYLLWDPDPNHSSGPLIRDMLNSMEFYGTYATDLPYGLLSIYRSLFVCTGIYPNNYFMSETSFAGTQISYYIEEQGGKVYMEGGDVWYDALGNNGYNFGPLFGIDPEYNSIGLFQGLNGCSTTFTEGMSFTYSGEATLIDYIDSIGGSQLIFKKRNSNYGCGVAQANRTVGLSFELGSLADSIPPSTRLALIDSIMEYFAILPTGIHGAQEFISAPLVTLTCHPNPFRQMTDIHYTIHDPRCTIHDLSLGIYDVAGRLVKSFQLPNSDLFSSNFAIWDGRDDSGRELAQGIYFIHLTAKGLEKTLKTILLR